LTKYNILSILKSECLLKLSKIYQLKKGLRKSCHKDNLLVMTQKPNNLKSLYLTDPKEPIVVLSCPQLGLEETIVETILDTGFNGELALPHILIQGSDLEKDLIVDDIDLASGSALAYFSNLEINLFRKKILS
jgi:hypothetical protein